MANTFTGSLVEPDSSTSAASSDSAVWSLLLLMLRSQVPRQLSAIPRKYSPALGILASLASIVTTDQRNVWGFEDLALTSP